MLKKAAWIVGEILCLTLAVTNICRPGRNIQDIERNKPGYGSRVVELKARFEDQTYPVSVEIGERKYRPEELEAVFEQGKERLDEIWLGENETPDHVTKPLDFVQNIEGLGLNVQWIPDHLRFLNSDGSITEEAFAAAPVRMKIRAVLGYEGESHSYDYECTICTADSEDAGYAPAALQQKVSQMNKDQPSDAVIVLPEEIDGEKVHWYVPGRKTGFKVYVFAHVILILLYFVKKERLSETVKKRQEALNRDYPEIVYRLIVLIGAGMTVRRAWEKTIEDYKEMAEQQKMIRPGYEEMETALREMNYGTAELRAYENFGRRCENQRYIRLASLLIQQVRRGARGMNDLLRQEIAETEVIRRENARQMAEEAGMKLIFPMILLMIVVFAILMIPAFLTLNI